MVLAFWNHDTTEAELVQLLGTRPFGTPAPHIHRLAQLGFAVAYESGTLAHIRAYLNSGIPCLLFVQTGDLPYWQENTAHVVVAIGIDEQTIFVNDPAFENAPQTIPLDHFLLAWSEFDHRYAVFQPEHQTG
ncbi:MAG: C39 family peptidase [Chloroflexi bacterium]|nr:C39 family peptidase [Chloroflexota bacterium]MCI0577267.1 C39 family peptidase [Chloroflexota bacterium]MCI0648212.1 C39 family peptidase [Chloroflexota bacterium]MCI0730151.1 C39 family peptidase [Chloroflexota bacterium]